MRQAISGVSPPQLGEVTIMTVWPSIGAEPIGRWIGQMCLVNAGFGDFFTLGKLFAVLTIPLALAGFFKGISPFVCRRYRLTNQRVVVQKGLTAVDEKSVSLDNFDSIDVEVLPGQEWFPCGELIFRKGPLETFRLSGVPRPETFKQTCLKAQRGHVGVKKALALA